MAQLHEIELQTQITSSPAKLFDIYKNETHLMPHICPDKLQSIQVIQGDGKSVGSVRLWTYVMGATVIAKDKIVGVDEEKKSITFELIGGEVTKYYNNFKATLAVMSGKAGKNTVKWRLEYEKASEDVPDPHSHLEFLVTMSREIDAYLFKT